MSSLIRMVIDFVMSHTFLILQLSLDLFLIVLLILMFRRRKAADKTHLQPRLSGAGGDPVRPQLSLQSA